MQVNNGTLYADMTGTTTIYVCPDNKGCPLQGISRQAKHSIGTGLVVLSIGHFKLQLTLSYNHDATDVSTVF